MKLVISLLIVVLTSCKYDNCEEIREGFRNSFDCNMVLKKKEILMDVVLVMDGEDVKTHKPKTIVDGSKHLLIYYDRFRIGDTIVKEKGKFTVRIFRRGQVIPIYHSCGENIED